MPLTDTTVDLTVLRELALLQAQREGLVYLVILRCDPKEQWSEKLAYYVAEEQATKWERENHSERVTP